MHLPEAAPRLKPHIAPVDEPPDELVRRLLAAQLRALHDAPPSEPSLWASLEQIHAEFVVALADADTAVVRRYLSQLFQTPLVWGLLYPDREIAMQGEPDPSWESAAFVDLVVSFAEALGLLPVRSIEQQGLEVYRRALDVDVGLLLERIERRARTELSFPALAGARAFAAKGRLFTADSIVHGYVAHRLRELGATPRSRIVEVGGGYGCFAFLAVRAGFRNFTIFDLPWVNVLQGFVLGRTLDAAHLALYGEPPAPVRVLPAWGFAELPDRSVDVAVNVNSLPEIPPLEASNYIREIARVLRGTFLSINQEARAPVAGTDAHQNWVAEIAGAEPGLRRTSRSIWWMRQGYVEETYVPA